MSTYVIVEELGDWPCHADYLLTARTYLQHGVPTTGGRPRIINLCRNLEHLSAGYYCSLLAQARSHHCLPGLQAISRLQPQQRVAERPGDEPGQAGADGRRQNQPDNAQRPMHRHVHPLRRQHLCANPRK